MQDRPKVGLVCLLVQGATRMHGRVGPQPQARLLRQIDLSSDTVLRWKPQVAQARITCHASVLICYPFFFMRRAPSPSRDKSMLSLSRDEPVSPNACGRHVTVQGWISTIDFRRICHFSSTYVLSRLLDHQTLIHYTNALH